MGLNFDPPALDFDAPLVSCPLCGQGELEDYMTDAAGVRISSCVSCELRFMNPQYTDASLEAFYTGYRSVSHLPLGEFELPRRERKLRNLEQVRRRTSPGRFLAVGCGDGLELVIARELGFEVTGLEVDAARAQRLEEFFELPVLSGHLPTVPLEEQSFSVVYMDQVLEHPKNPGEYLERAHQLLAPGGLLYVGVPNTRSISSRIKSLRDSLGLRAARKRGSHYDTWQHLSYFGPAQLTRALEQSFDFEVLLVQGDPVVDARLECEAYGFVVAHGVLAPGGLPGRI